MEASKKGLSLNKRELRTLMRFSSREKDDRDRYGVQFMIADGSCFARASNSRVSIEFEGNADGAPDVEVFIHKKFLIDCGKELGAADKQVARLVFKNGSLTDCVIEENGVVQLTLKSPADAAVPQCSFPNLDKVLRKPIATREMAPVVALSAEYMSYVVLAAEAVDEDVVDWYPPIEGGHPMIFIAGAKKDTTAIGAILPNVSEAAYKAKREEEERKAKEAEADAAGDGPLYPKKKKGDNGEDAGDADDLN